MTLSIIFFKVISLFLAIRFLKNIKITKGKAAYYFNQFKQLKKGLKLLYGFALVLIVGQFIPFKKIQGFVNHPFKKEIIVDDLIGNWAIEASSNTIRYYDNRKCSLNTKEGRWGITNDILYLTFDSTTRTQEYIIHELTADYYEMTDLDTDITYRAHKFDN
jgi:hypothetical protein